ncbi:MAG: 23S rRNA (pseudouridine(1915)-N(3))-methyltransferase RlmH [Eubacteriales bacterium]|nr:23S rRNA (pseudouridine(1915)-N(3))-methyltransferase RlmH [Eubacteriales bacterium]
MKTNIIAVGKLKEEYLRDACDEYTKRLVPFTKTVITEIAEERCGDNPSAAEINNVLTKEGERIVSKIPKGSYVIPMCIEGTQLSSPEFSKHIENVAVKGFSEITFVIGGSFGLSEKVKALGNCKLSFGKLTLPHQLMRVVLLEQIYRAFTISAGTKYHK